MNKKGGVGKTTTTVNLGVALSGRSYKVLLVDLDPAGNMTHWLSGNGDLQMPGLSEILGGNGASMDAISKSEGLRLDYIPMGENLGNLASNGRIGYYALREKLTGVRDRYDFVLLDCPPSSDVLIGNSLMASDNIIIPIQTETLPLRAGVRFLDWISDFSKRHNHPVEILGILPCMFDSRTRLSRLILEAMKSSEHLGPLVFNTVIRNNVRLAELSGADKSIFKAASTSFGASDYGDLADEVLSRLNIEKSEQPETEPLEPPVEVFGDFEESAGPFDRGAGAELIYRESGSSGYSGSDSKEEG